MSRWCLEVVGISKHLVWCHIFGKCQNLGGSDEMYYAATIQFSKNVQFVIAITTNLFLPMSIWCLKVVEISEHVVWCRIFGKCQNLHGSDEMYYTATIQFSKNIELVHCNYHKFIFTNE